MGLFPRLAASPLSISSIREMSHHSAPQNEVDTAPSDKTSQWDDCEDYPSNCGNFCRFLLTKQTESKPGSTVPGAKDYCDSASW